MGKNNNNNSSSSYQKQRKKFSNQTKPRYGIPGIFITCERGREMKSKREGLEMILHYYNNSNIKPEDAQKEKVNGENHTVKNAELTDVKEKKKCMSLDDEIELLKKQSKSDCQDTEEIETDDGDGKGKQRRRNKRNNKKKGPFSYYDAGCPGITFLMFNHPSFAPADEEQKPDKDNNVVSKDDRNDNEKNEADDVAPKAKKQKLDTPPDEQKEQKQQSLVGLEESQSQQKILKPPFIITQQETCWDPVPTIQTLIKETFQSVFPKGNNINPASLPSSRFVTRMIPIQATCSSHIRDIRDTVQYLIPKFIPQHEKRGKNKNDDKDITEEKKKKKFAITFKKRSCSHLKQSEVISSVAALFMPDDISDEQREFQVDLDNPEYVIMIEVMKTLCGVSIVRNYPDSFFYEGLTALEDLGGKEEEAKANDGNSNKIPKIKKHHFNFNLFECRDFAKDVKEKLNI